MPSIWSSHAELTDLNGERRLMDRGRPRTLYLRIETVNTCNNDCVMCAYGDHQRPKKIMPMSVFEKTVRDYAAIGGGYVSLTPLVGDVLLDKYLVQRIEFLQSIPEISGFGFLTNGAMAHRFDDETLAWLLGSLSQIGISIYGITADEYVQITQRATFDRMKQAINRIVSFSPVRVALHFRLFNAKTSEEVMGWLRTEVFPGGQFSRIADRIRIGSIITDYANWGIYGPENRPLPGDAKWLPPSRLDNRPQCLIPLFACLVFSDGNVSFCSCDNFDDVAELRLGNVMENSLAEIYDSDRVRRLWDWKACGTPDFCKRCSFHIPMQHLNANASLLENPFELTGA